ncbi:PREDICTED: uncharacterized protein LOC104801327 isoform X2 [Tarenaya hassleriana]|uniref:uncharacterized protein LOC104801327 isoform X2 n=1 Tax=Tarenaya hassleriana TaxID=28532 RepID=UPI00053C6FEE|nr:PREDICTED: uncharacterized protein LOC104801327 isoform X2 [Tarenaya hassleriana]
MISAEEAWPSAMEMAAPHYAAAKTSVWWDIENCPVPNGLDANGVAQNISLALVKMNYFGPFSISAYGDTNRIPYSAQQALYSSGVALFHVPSVDNPSPANVMLISSDRGFANSLHQLSIRSYNILLGQPQKASSTLLMASAKTVWLWPSLAMGGLPLSRGESSGLVANGCYSSDSETSYHSVSGQVLSSPYMYSDSEDCESRGGGYISKPWNQHVLQYETGRNELLSNGGTNESFRVCLLCNVVCNGFVPFTAHLSGRRHAAQVALVLSGGGAGPFFALLGGQVGVSTKPITKPKLVKPVFCNICQISCNSKIVYADHILGQKHQMNLELKLGKPRNTCSGSDEDLEDEVERKKKKVIERGAEAGAVRVCGLCSVVCNSQIAFESHLRGLKHAAAMAKKLTPGRANNADSASIRVGDTVGAFRGSVFKICYRARGMLQMFGYPHGRRGCALYIILLPYQQNNSTHTWSFLRRLEIPTHQ